MSTHDIERQIVHRIVDDVIAAGLRISVDDGGDFPIRKSADAKAVKAVLFATDQEILLIRDAAGNRIGGVVLVYGNDGHDVIADHTDTPEMVKLLAGATALAERLAA